MLDLLAQVTTTAPSAATRPAPDSVNALVTYGPLIVGGLLLYFVVFRGKKRQEADRRNLIDAIKRGDEIQTIGGVIGKVVETREDRVQVKVDESTNTKVWFARAAIAKVLSAETAEKK